MGAMDFVFGPSCDGRRSCVPVSCQPWMLGSCPGTAACPGGTSCLARAVAPEAHPSFEPREDQKPLPKSQGGVDSRLRAEPLQCVGPAVRHTLPWY